VNLGVTQQNIVYEDIGIVLRVTPRIGPDNSVLMRVEPQVSDAVPTNVAIQPGIFAFAVNTQTVETTVLAADGETVVLGGLISKRDEKTERKIPWVGDLPWVGAAFRFRSQVQERREIVFIMTPRIVRSRDDMRAILAAEARKMSWSITDVANVAGLNPDLLKARLSDPACVEPATPTSPVYLPLSPNGGVAPTYYPTLPPGYGVAPGVPVAAAPPQAQPVQYQYPSPQQHQQPGQHVPPQPPQPLTFTPVGQPAPQLYAVPTQPAVPGAVVPPPVAPVAYQPSPTSGWTNQPAATGGR
jgi:hypothetical protein